MEKPNITEEANTPFSEVNTSMNAMDARYTVRYNSSVSSISPEDEVAVMFSPTVVYVNVDTFRDVVELSDMLVPYVDTVEVAC